MNKNILNIITTFIIMIFVIGGISLWYFSGSKVSKLWIERELKQHFDSSYNWGTSQSRYNISGMTQFTGMNDSGDIIIENKTAFDGKRDIIFYPDKNLQDINFNNLSGNWMMYGIPQKDDYEIGISVCDNGIFGCETTYYKNPLCLKLIYIPRYLDRQREEVMSGCQVIDISKNGRTNLYFSVKY